MTSERRDSISEDWEELDTVGSVMSFDGSSRPTSPAPLEEQTPVTVPPTVQECLSPYLSLVLRPKDDKAVNLPPVQGHSNTDTKSGLQPKDDNAVNPELPSTTTVTSSESSSFQPPRNDDISPAPQNLVMKMREPGDLPLYWNGKEWRWGDEDPDVETGDNQDQSNGVLDLNDNPRVYHEACTDVMTALADVTNLAHEIGGHRISTTSMIRQTCEQLLIQTKELKTMLKVYRNRWMAQESMVDIPLSPDVLELLTQLRSQLWTTATELKGVKPEKGVVLQAQDIAIDANLRLAGCGEGLGQFSNSFADFLPIMRADFDTFTTKNIAFQPASTGSVLRPRRRIPPSPTVSRVRKELYALKDCLASMSCFLKEVDTDPCFDWIIDPAVTDSADLVVDVITKTLTNNPSEWIDSHTAVQGGLTYQQFVELDSEILHDIYLHLKSHKDDLDMVPDEDEDGALFSWARVRDYQCKQLGHGGMLEAINSLIEFVRQLLLIPE
ncbi:hypothetical protein FVEN_g7756 [Fusarium venenatum]|nr:hypothetical protein FVEN_g7756 [Fusarium venenatum]KAH6964835.1 hypothetical protein EDB82DRAFT_540115 [Fusarium venenatum]